MFQVGITGSSRPFVEYLSSGAWMHVYGKTTRGKFETKFVRLEQSGSLTIASSLIMISLSWFCIAVSSTLYVSDGPHVASSTASVGVVIGIVFGISESIKALPQYKAARSEMFYFQPFSVIIIFINVASICHKL